MNRWVRLGRLALACLALACALKAAWWRWQPEAFLARSASLDARRRLESMGEQETRRVEAAVGRGAVRANLRPLRNAEALARRARERGDALDRRQRGLDAAARALVVAGLVLAALAALSCAREAGAWTLTLALQGATAAGAAAAIAFLRASGGWAALAPVFLLAGWHAQRYRRAGPDPAARLAWALAPALAAVCVAAGLALERPGFVEEIEGRQAVPLGLAAAWLAWCALTLPRRAALLDDEGWRPPHPARTALLRRPWHRAWQGYAALAAAIVAAWVPASLIALNALLLWKPRWFFDVAGASPWCATAALGAALAALAAGLGRWRERCLAAVGAVLVEEDAFRVRLGSRTLATVRLRHADAPAHPRAQRPFSLQLAGLVLAAAVCSLAASRIWKARIAAIESRRLAEGLPVSLAQLHREVPADREAYAMLAALLGKRRFAFDPERRPGMRVGRWTPETAAAARTLAAAEEPFLRERLVPALRDRPFLQTIDYRRLARTPIAGETATVSYSGFLPVSAIIMELAGLAAFESDDAKAWGWVDLELRLAELFTQDRLFGSRVTALQFSVRAAQAALTVLLNRPGATLPAATSLALARAASTPYLAECGDMESLLWLDLYRAPTYLLDGGERAAWTLRAAEKLWRGTNLVAAGAVVGLEDHEPVMVPPSWPALAAWRSALRRPEALGWLRRIADTIIPDPAALPRLLRRDHEAAAWARLALAYSALRAHRLERGRYPERLADLAPRWAPLDSLLDPFTDAPLGYRAAGGKAELWSEGPFKTRTDSKGQELVVRE
ncbi:MAG: hypothetical protein HY553_16140 [Elusimicrobia bacterium]|nr:hypothetical protein [Elusimicrobiota bacterium]